MSFPVVAGLRSLELGSPGASRQRLTALVLEGRKRATAGLVAEYEREGEPPEHVGERLALLDDDGAHCATVVVTRVDLCRFDEVPDDFALAEGEGDLTGDDFRESHHRFWTRHGEVVEDATPLVLVRFELERAG